MEFIKHDDKTVTTSDVIAAIESMAPVGLQEEWDNSGLMIGFKDAPVKKFLTCLEINEEVVRVAENLDVDMIVTHHPLIFGGFKSLCTCNYKDRLIMDIIRNGMSVYSCHAPFD